MQNVLRLSVQSLWANHRLCYSNSCGVIQGQQLLFISLRSSIPSNTLWFQELKDTITLPTITPSNKLQFTEQINKDFQ